jgi:nitric oxide reductase NorE protein
METTKIDYKNILYPPGGILLWILITLELITFGVALIVMVINSKDDPQLFHESRLHLNATFGAMNTIFLLTSGFFMATTVHQYHQKDFKKANFFLNITMLGGLLFLILKSVEYYMKIESGNTMGSNSFFTYYWLLTGFHVIHVIVGLMILLFLKRGLKRSETETEDIEASAAFWHMCDLIWLILFPTLYLIL